MKLNEKQIEKIAEYISLSTSNLSKDCKNCRKRALSFEFVLSLPCQLYKDLIKATHGTTPNKKLEFLLSLRKESFTGDNNNLTIDDIDIEK